ncbi:ABC transporter ATP-binding protein [Variovorax sp. J22G73]|jgi:branched-chain amino acid transport system ATP-binding protein|uniref:ABC transporter ATP-binding protein n=1 Tax=unclassified Variovorax TaxID=663243 RepID=UPI0025767ECB|nr:MULTISPECIES: ABC transporter ATP-binding protein [unclassified Variovorax]MDM0005525.1 ABC transporter ATP-binding protein [Variovorax sp. J22R203]MDM0099552.1 ABC transporter ATP-binding protein [Variovorax sp. J22G73]
MSAATPMQRDDALLRVSDLHVHYGKSHVLHGVDLRVARNEVISLLGRNGSGRSTTMKAIMGLVAPSSGSIRLGERELAGARPYAVCRAGIGFVPEEREVFANLTVDENLRMGEQPAAGGAHRWTIEQMFDYFPRLKERRNTKAGSMSGGEQQMLTMCRSLLGNPQVMLIDEPTEGLAPKIVAQVGECIVDMHRKGLSVVLVEQKLAIALKVSTRVCVMGHGRIVFEGSPQALMSDQKLVSEWLAV